MIDNVIYGRIIIDTIHLQDGQIFRDLLGGGAPQAAFGARLWDPSIGLIVRSGEDIPDAAEKCLRSLDIDLSGWIKIPDLNTPKGIPIRYDEEGYRVVNLSKEERVNLFNKRFLSLHNRVVPIPEKYSSPKLIHILTDYPVEPMIEKIIATKNKETIFSLEPMFDHKTWIYKNEMLELLQKADIFSPDWPSASGIAENDNPFDVMKYWINLYKNFEPKIIAIRNGEKGSYLWERKSDTIWHIPTIKTGVIDQTGCGNSYAAGLSIGFSKHKDGKIAGACATASASILLQYVGIPSMSNKLQIKAVEIRDWILEKIKKL